MLQFRPIRIGRLAGIDISLHPMHPFYLLLMVLFIGQRSTGEGMLAMAYTAAVMVVLSISVLLHELGHCFAARAFGLSATEAILWPLGGLAIVGRSRVPQEEIGVAAAGPVVNLVLAGLLIPIVMTMGGDWTESLSLYLISGEFTWTNLAIDSLRINLLLGILNLIIPAIPMDGGRIVTGILWPFIGRVRATAITGFLAHIVGAGLIAWGLYFGATSGQWIAALMLLLVGVFVIQGGRQMIRDARAGASHEPEFEPEWKEKEPGWFEKMKQRRSDKRQELEDAAREAEGIRVDALLEKISSEGMTALTHEEREFLRKYSERQD